MGCSRIVVPILYELRVYRINKNNHVWRLYVIRVSLLFIIHFNQKSKQVFIWELHMHLAFVQLCSDAEKGNK